MKLASVADGSRDGSLVVVRSDGLVYADAFDAARTMDELLEDWHTAALDLRQIAQRVELDATPTMQVDRPRLMPPLPRLHGWLDGAQGEPGELLGPDATLQLPPGSRATIRPELCIVTGDVRTGATAPALDHVRLLLLALCVEVTVDGRPPSAAATPPFRRPATVFAPFAASLEGLEKAFDGASIDLSISLRQDGGEPRELRVDGLEPGPRLEAIRSVRNLVSGTVVTTGAFDIDPLPFDRGAVVELESGPFGWASCSRL